MIIVRFIKAVYWMIRSLVLGRMYYDDGSSEATKRIWVWQALRPMPTVWMYEHTAWLFDKKICGCGYWKLLGRQLMWCTRHFSEDRINNPTK